MRSVGFVLLAVASALLATTRPASGESNARHNAVRLEIAVANGRGRVLCGVYERSGWLKRPLHAAAASIQGNHALCQFVDLKPGTYAVGAFQDENLNGRLDRTWTGGAAEPWCVSRETRGLFGPPSFDSASFRLAEGTVSLRCRAR